MTARLVVAGTVALLFAGVALFSAFTAVGAFEVIFMGWTGDPGPDEIAVLQERQARAQGEISAYLPLVGWSLFGAIAAVAAALVISALGRGRTAA